MPEGAYVVTSKSDISRSAENPDTVDREVRATSLPPAPQYDWHFACLKDGVVASLIVLLIGLACALTSRILLFLAAMNISAAWSVGVWLPFGPTLFRLSYPEEARRSQIFRLLTLPCLLYYMWAGPGLGSDLAKGKSPNLFSFSSKKPTAYAVEHHPTPLPTPSLEERKMANEKEFARLKKYAEELKLRKRDLLKSDVDGNWAYERELARYNRAFARATAEKNAIVARLDAD